ncbi:MAG: TRAP transporter permease [Reyranellaceae bacterium]
MAMNVDDQIETHNREGEQLARLGETTMHGLKGVAVPVIFWIGVVFSLYQIYTAAYSPLSSLVMRSLHVGFLLLLAFLLHRATRGADRSSVPWYDWILGIAAFALSFYHWIFEVEIITRQGDPTETDFWVGVAVLVLLFEAARRIMGLALPLICLAFIAYAYFGRSIPAPFIHRGYDEVRIVGELYLGFEGIYGIPTLVSSTYVFLFILFGAFLEKAGMIGLFTDISLGTVGHTRGGPAKVAVITSGMMGTINGSGVANVVTTGQFTIPLMMRFGYRPAFAGAVEATSSMGGQIMPPVMGAVAFIMAETIDMPYVQICLAAIIPALLYYATAFWMVHLEAGRAGLRGIPKEDRPDPIAAIKKKWHLLLPLAALVYLLFSGYTPLFAGTVGLALTVIFILGASNVSRFGAFPLRAAFWVVIAVASAALFEVSGITGLFVVVGVLILASLLAAGTRATISMCVNALSDGARQALGVGIACALVGVIIGVMTLTGLAGTFARIVLDLAGGSLFLTLLMTMVICLILGMGIPTIPNYIITSTMAAPILLQMGVPLIVSHMFVFYFGIMADLTPPVALAAFAASAIARENAMRIAVIATRIAVAGYVVPFMAVYDPALMMQTDNPLAVIYMVLKAGIGITLWGAAVTGYFLAPINPLERIWAFGGAAFLVAALPLTDEIGFAASAAFVIWHWLRVKRAPAGARPR